MSGRRHSGRAGPPRLLRLSGVLGLALVASACMYKGEHRDVHEEVALEPPAAAAVLAAITADDLARHVDELSSDLYEGRGPGTPGEERTVAYLTAELEKIGLEPGNPDGTWVQRVPLVGHTSTARARFVFDGETIEPQMPAEWVAGAGQVAAELRVDDRELVFVGYGVRAPEFEWDDYAGLDVAGKTLLVLVNDPAVADPEDPESLDPDVFRGKAMTYYGRWTYKYEIAGELGAAAVLIVHTTEAAGYDWNVVERSFGSERFDLDAPDLATAAAPVQGWVTHDLFERLCRAGGHDPAELEALARTRDFRPVPLGGRASIALETSMRRIESRNVVGLLRGSDPEVSDELVVYTAHWDHLGVDADVEAAGGDGIYNGALDNATGTGGVLELADGFATLSRAPRRSILFMLTTAEEKGLLGAAWYASHPLYPLEKTLANVNIDGLNVLGRARDIQVVGDGNTTLEELLIAASVQQGRYVRPDTDPEKGYYYRSDHFEFAKRGVPALYVKAGSDIVGRPDGYGAEKRAEYLSGRYHGPEDEVQPDWDYAGAVDDLYLLFRVGLNVASAARFPEWKPGTEFRARREAMLGPQG